MDGYGLEARLDRLTAIGLVPAGARIDVVFVGAITDGPLAGGVVEGLNYLVMHRDGTSVIDAREVITTPSGGFISVESTGYIVPTRPLPPVEEIVSPEFVWPDVDLLLNGASRMSTSAPELADVNVTTYAFTGVANVARGTLRTRTRSVTSLAELIQATPEQRRDPCFDGPEFAEIYLMT